jgi:hypothetical protein
MSPAYQYSTWTNPLSATIAELLQHQGDIRARQALTVGEAQARAAEQSGNAWGQAIGGIGQTIAAIPQQIQQAKQQQLQSGVLQSQIDSAKALAAERQAKVAADARDQKAQELWSQAIKGSVGEDGLPDYQRAASLVEQAGFPIQAQSYLENADQAATRRLNRVKLARDLHAATQNDIGEYALETLHALDAAKNPLQARDIFTGKLARAASDGLLSEEEAGRLMMHTAQAQPDQLKTWLEQLVPEGLKAREATRLKTEADLAKTQAETQNLKDYGRTTPGSLEEQYLHKLTTGDTAGATQILASLRATAQAKRDPAAASLAAELGALRVDQARERLKTLRDEAEPLDIGPDVQTTESGRTYIDLSAYQGKDRNKAREAANVAGAIAVSKEQANALQEISNARANQRAILDQVQDLLPQGVAGRGGAALTVPLSKLFQTNDQIAAFNSWRTAAIQTLRATAGSKGLRINQAEIAQAIENDIPKLTDTLGTAQQKFKNIDTMLENAERSVLVRDRSVKPTVTPPPAPIAPMTSHGAGNPRLPKF